MFSLISLTCTIALFEISTGKSNDKHNFVLSYISFNKYSDKGFKWTLIHLLGLIVTLNFDRFKSYLVGSLVQGAIIIDYKY